MAFHKHPLFPIVLGSLTLVLAIFVGYALWGKSQAPASTSLTGAPADVAVTEQGYRDAAVQLLAAFDAQYASAANDDARRAAVETAYNGLLALRVPGGDRDLHLGLVTSFYLMRDGLLGTEGAFDQGWSRYQQLLSDNPWL